MKTSLSARSRAVRGLPAPLSLVALASLMAACNDSSTADPETIVKGDLNPPAALVSVTDDQSLLLQWTITNTEDDIVGYNVYVAEGTLAPKVSGSITDKLKGKAVGIDLSTQQVRRCKDTVDLFSVFGFDPKADQAQTDCDDFGDDNAAAAPSSSSGADSGDSQQNLTEGEAAPTFVACTGLDGKAIGTAGKVSVDIAKAVDVEGEALPKQPAKRVGKQLACKLGNNTKLSDGKTGFENGKRYVAFVVAVMGDDADEISYTSNFVEDSPAPHTKVSFSNLANGYYIPLELKLENDVPTGGFSNHVASPIVAGGGSEVTLPQAGVVACPGDGSSTCGVGDQLTFAAGASGPRFAIVGDVTRNSERVWIAGEKDKVLFAPALARVDYANGRPGIKAPEDKAIEYSPAGADKVFFSTNLQAAPGALFYVAVKGSGSNWHYGKLYMQELKTTAGENGLAAGDGAKSGTFWFALQKEAGSTFVETAGGLSFPLPKAFDFLSR